MSIKNAGQNRWHVRVRTRRDGKEIERKATITGARQDAKAAEVQLQKELDNANKGSLKIETFAEALDYFREHTTAKLDSINPIINKLVRDLGPVRLNELAEKYGEYSKALEKDRAQRTGKPLSPVFKNRLLAYGRQALSLCLKRGLIDHNPLKGFDMMMETPRDRVLSEDERWRLLDVLQRHNSYLLPAVKFSLKNPIRKGDLLKLRRENLNRLGRYIHHLPAKTRKKKPQECFLECIDDDMLTYFDSLPPECEYLFPRKVGDEYNDLGDFKNHWHTMLREARIDDFHWHDLKHCAITFMIDSGYTILDLKNLGIQFSEKMVERYYNFSAKKVIGKYRSIQNTTPKKQQKTAT